jgi:hypothetical protein
MKFASSGTPSARRAVKIIVNKNVSLQSAFRRLGSFVLGLTLAGSLFGSLSAPSAEAATKWSSVYVRVDQPSCQRTKQPDGTVMFVEWRCGKPVNGWTVYRWAEEDLQSIELRKGSVVHRLELELYANSSTIIGPNLEFRLKNGKPMATVVRLVDETGNVLVVNRFSVTTCVVAVVPAGPNQAATARAAADAAQTRRCL